MAHALLNATAYRAIGLTLPYTVSLGGAAVDFTGYTTTDLTCRVGKPEGILSTLTIGSGITLTTPASGVIAITLSPVVTDIEPGNYTIELLDKSGDAVMIATGTLTVRRSMEGLS